MRENTDNYRELFLNEVPLLDTRAPIEFGKGAFPGAVNLPLMDDFERQEVGTCYKQHGQDAAIALGHQLVNGPKKAERIAAWAAFAGANPHGYLYCFRGGLRSQITQQWLQEEAGVSYPRVLGGYKAMRAFLLQVTTQAVRECAFIVLGGMTGTGKTEVLGQLDNSLDLEGHARHRGSSFGRHAHAQPSQIDFENSLSIDILKKRAAHRELFIVEDESLLIGSCSLPIELHQGMQGYPMVWLEDSMANRIERILGDYVIDLCGEFVAAHGDEDGFPLFSRRLRESLDRIARRLGGERHQRLASIMDAALAEQQRSGAVDLHRGWIEGLLAEYYDPMYAYQRTLKSSRIEFTGNHAAVTDYLRRRRQ